ncbi:hypothetical protein LSH36_320g04041, partial [Paralvinella palmiformis]
GDCDYNANIECNGIHPDDLEWLREKYDEDRLEEKRRKFRLRKKTTTSGMKACSDISQVIMGKQGDDKADVNIASPKMNVSIGKTKSGKR